nr:hypothetical protein [Micromonospora sp. DSM 115978]
MAAIPAGPIDREPAGLPPGRDEEGLHRVLAGVPLGAHDERIIHWLTMWESSTVATVASLIHRARLVGRLSETP